MHEHLLRVGGQIRELVHRRALPAELRRLLRGTHGPRLAEMGAPGQTVGAVSAEDRQTRDHVIARLELCDVRADRFDDAGGLVAEDRGGREGIEPVDEVEVAVAHATRDRAHEDLAPDRLRDVDVLDGERFLGTMEHGGTHAPMIHRFIV